MAVRIGGTDQADRTGCGKHVQSNVPDQNVTAKRQQGLVFSHPLAAAAGQNEARGMASGSLAGAVHEKIIALTLRKKDCL